MYVLNLFLGLSLQKLRTDETDEKHITSFLATFALNHNWTNKREKYKLILIHEVFKSECDKVMKFPLSTYFP